MLEQNLLIDLILTVDQFADNADVLQMFLEIGEISVMPHYTKPHKVSIAIPRVGLWLCPFPAPFSCPWMTLGQAIFLIR
jgi:hypothetical protein